MIEIELRKILETISEIKNKIFYLESPKTTQTPRVVYTQNRSEEEYVLTGTTGNRWVNFDINVYANNATLLQTIKYKIREKLLSLLGTTQGAFYIQKVRVDMRDMPEMEVGLYRTVIELEIFI